MTILQAIQDRKLFKPWFAGSTWNSWRTFLKVLFALPLDEDDVATYQRHTQRATLPQQPFREGWLVVGRRGGKSLLAALVAVFLACFRDYAKFLKPGEVATIAVIAADRRQARVILRYIRGFLEIPMLRRLVVNDVTESIEFSNRVVIEVHTCGFRSVRGYTYAAVLCDEIAFWQTDDSARPDNELIAAVRPGLSTIPNAMLLCISSPYARRGSLWNTYSRHFGKDDSRILVWQGTTAEMNPSIDPAIIEAALEEDESAARAEYFGQFRRDIETFVDPQVVRSLVIPDRHELGPLRDVNYVGFTDPAGGSGQDSYTLAIVHLDATKRLIVDCIREKRPPFSPEETTKEFAGTLSQYRIYAVTGDRYAGEWPAEQFRKYGVTYKVSDKAKSDIYKDALPLLNSGSVELLDEPRLVSQFCRLERRTARGGRDSIDHEPGAHDDLSNAVAGALLLPARAPRAWTVPITGF